MRFSILVLLSIFLLLVACQVKQVKIEEFTIIEPKNGATNVSLNPKVVISDETEGPVAYDVFLDGKLVISRTSNRTIEISTKLPPDTYHTLKVVRKLFGKIKEDIAISVFKTTRPPTKPTYIFPKSGGKLPMGGVIEWTCVDPDGDELSFDVYFGDSPDNLMLVAENTKNTFYKPTGISVGKEYYWKIVAKDDKGAQTESDVYSFKIFLMIPENIVYVWGDGLWKIEVEDDGSISAEQVYPTQGSPGGAAYYEGRIYASYGDGNILVLDVSNPDSPRKIGEFKSGPAYLADVIADRYIAFYKHWYLWMYDLDTYAEKLNLFFGSERNGTVSVTYSDDYIFIVAGYEGNYYFLRIYDLDLNLIVSKDGVSADFRPAGILYHDGKIYLTRMKDGKTELAIYSFTSPENLDLSSPDEVITLDSEEHMWALPRIVGDWIFIKTGDERSYLYNPMTGDIKILEGIHDLKKLGDVYISSKVWWGTGGVESLDGNFNVIAEYDVHGETDRVIKVGDYVYALDHRENKLVIYDSDLNEKKVIDSGGGMEDWRLNGNNLYVLAGGSLRIYDVSDPLNPEELSNTRIDDWAHKVNIVGTYAYVSTPRYLKILDISDVKNPRILSSLDLGINGGFLGTDGNVAVVGNHGEGYVIVDVTDKENPKIVAEMKSEEGYHLGGDTLFSDGFAYVFADTNDGRMLIVYDVANPSNPRVVRKLGMNMCYDLGSNQIVGDYMFLQGCEDFVVMDISRRDLPVMILKTWIPGMYRMYVNGREVYVALGGAGVGKMELSDDMASLRAVMYAPWFYAHDILVVGE